MISNNLNQIIHTDSIRRNLEQMKGNAHQLRSGGLFPDIVTTNIESSLLSEENHISKVATLSYVPAKRLFLNDPDYLLKLNSYNNIIKEVEKIFNKNNDDTIYYVSLPVNDEHQVSLVIDNKKKIIYFADSLKRTQYKAIGDLKKIVSGKGKLIIDEQIKTQQPTEKNCGLHSFVNTKNRIAKIQDRYEYMVLNDQLRIKNAILELTPEIMREKINPVSLEIISILYYEYEKNNYDKNIELVINKIAIHNLFVEINENLISHIYQSLEICDDCIVTAIKEKLDFLSSTHSKLSERLIYNQIIFYLNSHPLSENYTKIIGLMESVYFNPNSQGVESKTLLHNLIESLIKNKDKETILNIIEYLLRKQVDINIQNNKGQPAFLLAENINDVSIRNQLSNLLRNRCKENSYYNHLKTMDSFKKVKEKISSCLKEINIQSPTYQLAYNIENTLNNHAFFYDQRSSIETISNYIIQLKVASQDVYRHPFSFFGYKNDVDYANEIIEILANLKKEIEPKVNFKY